MQQKKTNIPYLSAKANWRLQQQLEVIVVVKKKNTWWGYYSILQDVEYALNQPQIHDTLSPIDSEYRNPGITRGGNENGSWFSYV